MMLTKEEIESIRKEICAFYGMKRILALDELCELALERLAMEPRPIEEATEGEWCLVYDRNEHFSHGWSIRTLRDFKDAEDQVSKQWVDEYSRLRMSLGPTHFIPLSSLPKVST